MFNAGTLSVLKGYVVLHGEPRVFDHISHSDLNPMIWESILKSYDAHQQNICWDLHKSKILENPDFTCNNRYLSELAPYLFDQYMINLSLTSSQIRSVMYKGCCELEQCWSYITGEKLVFNAELWMLKRVYKITLSYIGGVSVQVGVATVYGPRRERPEEGWLEW